VTHYPESGLFIEEPTISPHGRFLVYTRRNGGSSLWVLQLGHAPPATLVIPPTVLVVMFLICVIGGNLALNAYFRSRRLRKG
jgi:hypothetical protein